MLEGRTRRTGRPRGRPRAFEREQALDRALEVFWKQGYEGASLADLTAAMGITAPSVYAAFGSKEGLYREALARYQATWGAGTARALLEEPTAYGAVARVLRDSASAFRAASTPAGCMISTAVLGCAPENRAAAGAAADLRRATLAAFADRFRRAIDVGELPGDVDPAALARFYGAVIQGMSVQAIDGADTDALMEIAENALRAWPGKRP